MTAGPDLSVVVPVFNAADTVEQALRSVLDQVPATRSVEIIVADDGSTDGTAEAVRRAASDERIRYFRQENAGPASARNLGLRECAGRCVMFVDADDDLVDGCVETTLDFLDEHPEVGLFFTNYDIYDENGVVTASGVDLWSRFRSIGHREVGPGEWIFTESLTPWILRHGAFMHTTGLTLRAEVVREVGFFRDGYSYAEDDDYYARAAWVTTAGYVDRVLSRKRNHPGSLIHAPENEARNIRHALELAELQLEEYREHPRLVRILERKVRDLAGVRAWSLIHAGESQEARELLAGHWRRHPWHWAYWWLWIRSWAPAGRGLSGP